MPTLSEIIRKTKVGELRWKLVRIDDDLFCDTQFQNWEIHLCLQPRNREYPFGVIFIKPVGTNEAFTFFNLNRRQQKYFTDLQEALCQSFKDKGIPEY